MKIAKIGHCCLVIETKGKRIMTDPGKFSTGQNSVTGIDLVLITHEHADHLHVESLREVIKSNSSAQILTNKAVGKILEKEGIVHSVVNDKEYLTLGDILIEAHDGKHEEIYKEIGQVQNTGFFIDGRLFYPGDSFQNPRKAIEVLALPIAGPWYRMADAINYAIRVKPKKAFPVHDGIVKDEAVEIFHRNPGRILIESGIEFISMESGDAIEF